MNRKKKSLRKPKTTQPSIEIAGVKLYTVQAIADAFSVNEITILRHIKKGRIIARQIGHKYYVEEENLRKFLTSLGMVKSKNNVEHVD